MHSMLWSLLLNLMVLVMSLVSETYREDVHEMVAEKEPGYVTLLTVCLASSPATRNNHSLCIVTQTVNVYAL
jgi:hypothetical protein